MVFRWPLRLYRREWGWMLGRTFLLLAHAGRKTGTRYETVAMVLADDPSTGELVICAAWGSDVDWVRNLRAGPAIEVRVGRDSFVPDHRFLDEDESFVVAVAFRRRHLWRLRLMGRILGWGDLTHDAAVHEFVCAHPFVALRPLSPATAFMG
jgi:deazaflavin-dependent oxidoreductase (nitroreductase family)